MELFQGIETIRKIANEGFNPEGYFVEKLKRDQDGTLTTYQDKINVERISIYSELLLLLYDRYGHYLGGQIAREILSIIHRIVVNDPSLQRLHALDELKNNINEWHTFYIVWKLLSVGSDIIIRNIDSYMERLAVDFAEESRIKINKLEENIEQKDQQLSQLTQQVKSLNKNLNKKTKNFLL